MRGMDFPLKIKVILGYFGKRENSWQYLIDDMNYLEGMMRLEYDEIPYFMVGHSMGSF